PRPARSPVRPHRDCDAEGEPGQPGPRGERVGEPHQLARIRPPAEGAVVPDDRLAVAVGHLVLEWRRDAFGGFTLGKLPREPGLVAIEQRRDAFLERRPPGEVLLERLGAGRGAAELVSLRCGQPPAPVDAGAAALLREQLLRVPQLALVLLLEPSQFGGGIGRTAGALAVALALTAVTR